MGVDREYFGTSRRDFGRMHDQYLTPPDPPDDCEWCGWELNEDGECENPNCDTNRPRPGPHEEWWEDDPDPYRTKREPNLEDLLP